MPLIDDGEPEEVVRRRPGRPRDEGARDTILAATLEVLAEVGFAAITVDAVAQRAGVGKATIYRRWDSKERLVTDAVTSSATTATPDPLPDTGTVAGDLRALYRTMAFQVSEPESRSLLAAMLALAAVDEEVNGRLQQMVDLRKERSRAVLHAAIARGDLAADTDVDLAIDLLSGAVMYRACFDGLAVSEGRADRIVELVLRAIRNSA